MRVLVDQRLHLRDLDAALPGDTGRLEACVRRRDVRVQARGASGDGIGGDDRVGWRVAADRDDHRSRVVRTGSASSTGRPRYSSMNGVPEVWFRLTARTTSPVSPSV